MSDDSIPIRTLRNDVSDVIRKVEAGASFDVTRHGTPVARITPIGPRKRWGTIEDLRQLRQAVPADAEWWAEVRAMRDADAPRDPFARFED